MLWLKRVRCDNYLKRFVTFYKEKYSENLVALVIYGSYNSSYFDKKKSDYDLFVIFKDKIPKSKKLAQKELNKKFPKITLQYFCSIDDLSKMVERGHWSIYITLLKNAKVLYSTSEYNYLIKEMKKIDFIEQLLDVVGMEYNLNYEIGVLKKSSKYKAVKWAFYSIRKRLQLLSYIRKRKVI